MQDVLARSDRLFVRYQEKSDIKFLVDLWMDPDVTKYSGGPREKAFLIEEFRKVADDPKALEYDLWPVVLKSTREPIGHAGFIPKEIKGKEYMELNYYIAKDKWGRGYGKEIAGALLNYAFTEKKLEKVISIIEPENEASKAVAKSIGMRYWMNEERSGRVKSVYVARKP